jgi:hypothetical protein
MEWYKSLLSVLSWLSFHQLIFPPFFLSFMARRSPRKKPISHVTVVGSDDEGFAAVASDDSHEHDVSIGKNHATTPVVELESEDGEV